MRPLLAAALLAASPACVGATPSDEERGPGLGIAPAASDPVGAPAAIPVAGWPLCAPCDGDDDCGPGTACDELAGTCEHVRGYCASNTRGPRPTEAIDRIVIHTTQGPAEAAVDWFLTRASGVSSHYVIGAEGWVGAVVSETAQAKHTANLDLDRRSIGIELEGFVDRPSESYTAAMFDALSSLVRDIANRHGIAIDREHVIGHVEVPDPAPAAAYCGGWSHHSDPGDGFDWERLMALARGETVAEAPGARWLERALFDPQILAVIPPPPSRPGDVVQVRVLARNAGRTVWEQTGLRLVTEDAGARELFVFGQWASRERPYLGGLGCHGPDTNAELTFSVRAPEAAEPRTAGGTFHFELLDRSFAVHRSAGFVVSFDVTPEGT